MHVPAFKRSLRHLAMLTPFLGLVGCFGEGNGPESIRGTAAAPVPVTSAGFCDPINFEVGCAQPGILNFNGGVSTVVDNPNKSGINDSDKVAEMTKRDEETFGGTRLNLALPVDFSAGESFRVKVLASRAVPLTFKLEDSSNPFNIVERVLSHSGSNAWESLCFDFTGAAAGLPVPALTLIFDNGVNGQVATDPDNWTFYYDDIEQLQSCSGSANPDVSIDPDASLFATAGAADLAIPGDYAEITAFGSGSIIDPLVTDDATFNPALSVFSGSGYGANVAQIGFIGFRPGFLGAYQSIDFKVKGVPNQVIFVKLFGSEETLRINLTSSARSTALENGWFQVSIPVANFSAISVGSGLVLESDNESPEAFRMLLTDVGFSGVGDNPPVETAAGVIPDTVIYASDPDETIDLLFGVDYAGFEPFGSGSTFDNNVTTDFDFNPAFGITTGSGYGAQVGQFAIVGFPAGFATAYESLVFKARDLNNDLIRVKLLDSDPYLDISLTDSSYSTALGNGWYQVVIPIADLSNADTATGLLFETDNTAASAFTFLLTDIGFNDRAVADPGVIPDDVIYASDPAVSVDLVFGVNYGGFDPFGSGSAFDNNVKGDADFSPAFAVTTGDGYGVQVGQFAITGFPEGFAAAYEALVFKAKGLNNNLIRVKLLPSEPYIDIDLVNSGLSTALGNGWYQVVVPIADFSAVATATALLFETDNTAPNSFTFLLTDFGFTRAEAGSAAITPDESAFSSDPGVTTSLAPPGGLSNFGSGAVFDTAFAGNADFNPALQITSGEGYAAGAHTGFVAFTGYAPGFAAGFESFQFKVNGDAENLTAFEVKFFAPDTSRTYDITTYAGATLLANGWYQVSIPMSDFAENIDANDGFLLGPLGAQAAPFTLLLTDIGFSGEVVATNPEVTLDAVAYATDAGLTENLAPPGGIVNFGSGAVFDLAFAGNPDFNPALQITSGEGYAAGAHTGFAAFTGYAAGFATGFETFHFKVNGDTENLTVFEVKFFAPDTSRTYDITNYAGATLLDNGWYQVSIPMSDFAENIDANDGFLLGPLGAQAAPFTLLLTDIGFTGGGN